MAPVTMLFCVLAQATGATRPADPTLDWLLEQATKPAAPATRSTEPATRPASPFQAKADDGYRPATLILSNGERIRGRFSTTMDRPIRLWDEARKEYRDIPYKLIRSMEAKVLWERDEKEWRFKESGSDIKVYSGKTYPAREMQYTVTLLNGQSVTGGVVAPLYMDTPGGDKVFVLHKRDKGEVGQTLKQLVYVQNIQFE